jgi:hypothetical protein
LIFVIAESFLTNSQTERAVLPAIVSQDEREASELRGRLVCWLLSTSVLVNRERANLCSIKRQRDISTTRQKGDVFSFFMDGKQRRDKKT